MATEFQRRKSRHLFNIYDRDGNGALERADYVAIARSLSAVRGWAEGSPEDQRAHATWVGGWNDICAALGMDPATGKLPFEGWSAIVEQMLASDAMMDHFAGQLTTVVFEAIDVDGDGEIGAKEYELLFAIFGLDPSGAPEAFANIDTDGSGQINRDELFAAVRAFVASDDPAAPGNRFFGALST